MTTEYEGIPFAVRKQYGLPAPAEPEPEPEPEPAVPPEAEPEVPLTPAEIAMKGYGLAPTAPPPPEPEPEVPPEPAPPAVIPEGVKAHEELLASITDLSKPEDYATYQTLIDRDKFTVAVNLGLIPEGSEFVPGLDIRYDPEVPIEERLEPKEWGYYTPEQVAEMAEARAERKEVEAQRARTLEVAEAYQAKLQAEFEAEKAEFEASLAEFETANTQLPDGQWIDNEQLASIKETNPDIHTILMTQGADVANKAIQERNEEIRKQQEAYRQLTADYRVAIPPDLPEGVDAVTGARIGYGIDVVGYLRDNPDQSALLVTAGFDAGEVTRLSEATIATEKYWTPDNQLDVYAAYIAGIDPEYIKTLTDRTEDEIKGVPPSLRGFEQSYAVTYPIPDFPLPKKFWPSLKRMKAWVERNRGITRWHKEAGIAYANIYGREALSNAVNIELATYAFAPARVLEPRVKLKDITTIEWVIGVAQIALYTAPFWVPKVAKVLKPLSKLERTARTAGNTRLRVNIAREEMLARAWNDPSYAKFASNLQHQIQASMKADRIFLDKLASLNKISPSQLATIEKLSGIKGLASSIKAVGVARTIVVKAWNVIDKSKYYTNPTTVAQIAANESYLVKLGVLQSAQNNLANALAKASGVLTPAYQLAPMAGWRNVIANTQREITRLNTELAKAEAIVNKSGLPSTVREAREYWLSIRDQLANAKSRLNTYQTASAAGKTPPMVAGYRIVDKTPTQLKMDRYDATQRKLDDFYRGIGKPRPTPAGGVATMERTLTAVEIPRGIVEVGFRPQYAQITAPAVIAPVPAVITPMPVSVGVLPTLVAPQIQVTTRTTTETVPVSRILTMTPEQAQRIYGDEILVDAVSPLLIPREKLKPGEWLSPAQAIEVAQQIAIQSYVQQITQAAVKQAQLLKTQGATQTAIQSAVQQAIQSQVKAIAEPALQTQVVTALQTMTAIQAIVTPAFLTTITPVSPVIPITPITPIVPIILPEVADRVPVTQPIEAGAIAFLMGMFWKYIPPPWDMDKPLTLPKGVVPEGARLDGRTPQETIQMIGVSTAVVPESISIDLGIVDVFISDFGRNIEFRGKGEGTDVGERLPSTTQGMSVDGAYPGALVYNEGVSRPLKRIKKPKRKPRRTDSDRDFSDILEVRGEI